MRKAMVGIAKSAFAAFLALLCADAHAAEHNWTRLHRINAQSGTVDVYVDAGTVTRKGDRVQVRSMNDLKGRDGIPSSIVTHSEFDCKKRKVRFLHSEFHPGTAMGAGQPKFSFDRPNNKFESFTPGTEAPAGIEYSYVCS